MAQNLKRGTSDITRVLRKMITQSTYSAGDRLPAERALAEEMNVSRGTIRSALQHLNDEGLVEIRPGSGAYVTRNGGAKTDTPVGASSPLELMDVRFGIEPHVCRLATMNGRLSDFNEMDLIVSRMESCLDDPSSFTTADTAFHTKLVETTRNGLMIWIYDQINRVRGQEEWARMAKLTLNRRTIAKYNQQHREILLALRERDPERASKVMKQHLESARVSLMRAAEA